MWKVVHTFSSLLLGKYKEAYNEYYTAIQGTTAEERRWEICLSSTSSSFGFALGRIFVDKSFRASAKTMVCFLALINNFSYYISTLFDGITSPKPGHAIVVHMSLNTTSP